MRSAIFVLFVALSAGCVPVTEPVGDIDKAEPDKALVGSWKEALGEDTITIDSPAVKGNPKGLMRVLFNGKWGSAGWFFVTKVGKHAYANPIVGQEKEKDPQFGNEGDFAKWQKLPDKRFLVLRYALDGDALTIDGPRCEVVKQVMEAGKISRNGGHYDTPAGWLEKYLDKNGPEKLFGDSYVGKYQRAKKK